MFTNPISYYFENKTTLLIWCNNLVILWRNHKLSPIDSVKCIVFPIKWGISHSFNQRFFQSWAKSCAYIISNCVSQSNYSQLLNRCGRATENWVCVEIWNLQCFFLSFLFNIKIISKFFSWALDILRRWILEKLSKLKLNRP